uniref:Uncharacterized protein n=1 Tax=Arundo donax TaxID=35708 RepID=A0A0A9FWS8_ARUDO
MSRSSFLWVQQCCDKKRDCTSST